MVTGHVSIKWDNKDLQITVQLFSKASLLMLCVKANNYFCCDSGMKASVFNLNELTKTNSV